MRKASGSVKSRPEAPACKSLGTKEKTRLAIFCRTSAGTPTLSPYLFTVYMLCVTKDVIQTGLGCHIGRKPVCIFLYADDIVILAQSWYAQQCLLNVCADSITRLGMSLNVSKSVTMI